ncbi:hypothetical protein BUL40_04925 [Croceivirga radicis]|uniref:Uncharacterized protein n=2 Tax=Croceivirga radicis TaxID=1929488 RepID=A0A1V6LUU9_9FLAO|nr:hypothetical protein BUL40_04925 [Croceivirga radicis]
MISPSKRLLIGFLFFTCYQLATAQVKIGADVNTINPASLLELESTSKALVLTRVTNQQMNAIFPLNGALVYNTDTQCVYFYNGTAWTNLCNANSGSSALTDNGNGTFTFLDANGVSTTFYGQPETVSTLTATGAAQYTYTNELGETTIIDIPTLNFSGSFNDLTDVPANLDLDSTDDFSGAWADLTGVPANLDLDSTDDFSGDFGDLANIPLGLADGDDDTTYSAGAGITITGTTIATDNSSIAPAWANITGIPANLDIDATDDFSGAWADLTGVPANLDLDATDDFSGAWADLTGVPANLDLDSTDDFSGDFGDLVNIPVGLADGDDDTTYSAGAGITITGTTIAADNSTISPAWANITGIPANLDLDSTDDFSGDFGDLANIPVGLADGDDDTTYSAGAGITITGTTIAADNSTIAPAWANITGIPANLDTDSTDDFSGAWADLTGVPANLDLDSTDDFSGAWADLTGVPTNLDLDSTDDFSGAWSDLTGVPANLDLDATDDFSGAWADLTGVPANLDLDSTDDFSGAWADLTGVPANLDLDSTDDFSGAWADLTGVPANLDLDSTDDFSGAWADLTGVPANLDLDSTDDFSGDFGDLANIPVGLADGDDDTTYSAGAGLTLTGTAFAVDNSSIAPVWTNISGVPANLDTDATDDFSGAWADLTGVPANLDLDATDDFSGDFGDLANIPVGLADGDDDTTYSAGAGITITGTTIAADNSTIAPAWANITGIPANLDTDATDDFSGAWADLTGVPANLDLDSTDDFSGAWADLTGVPANLDLDSTDDFSGAWADLTGVPANLDLDSTDDFSGDFGDLANIPVGLADGDDDTTYSAGAGITITGTTIAADNSTIAPAWANITGIPANLDTDATDDFSGAWADLTGIPANLDTDATDDFSGAWADLTGVPANLDLDSTDDFSGDFGDLANIPVGLADGDDDTTYSAGAGITITGTTIATDNSTIAPAWANITGIPANLDLDSTDDFSGVWADLTGVPANLDLDSTDDFSGAWADLTGVPANLDLDSTDDFSGAWADLTGVPANLDLNSTDDFSGAWADLTGVPANLDLDSTDDFSGDFGDLANIPVGLADGDDDTTYSAGAGITITGTTIAADNSTIANLANANLTLPAAIVRTVNQNGSDIAFTGNGNIGIGDGANPPTSKLDVAGEIKAEGINVSGALATPIDVTTGNLTLDETHHTIIIGGNHTITLPAASSCKGRMYIIKNPTALAVSISLYKNLLGLDITLVPLQKVIWIQSDGANWQLISQI